MSEGRILKFRGLGIEASGSSVSCDKHGGRGFGVQE